MLKVIDILFTVLLLPIYPLVYLICRMSAKECPKCGEDWYTELIGEWGDEDWKCRQCNHHWTIPYNKS